MRKIIIIILLFVAWLTAPYYCHAQTPPIVNRSNETIDLGGAVITQPLLYNNLSNVVVKNFELRGAGKITPTGTGSCTNVTFKDFKATNVTHVFESKTQSGWGVGPTINGLTLQCFTIDGAAGYVIWLANNVANYSVDHFKIVNTAKGGDGEHPAPVFAEGATGGKVDRFWVQQAYGGFRFFQGASVTNGVIVDAKNYSAVEYNGALKQQFNLLIDNCVFGNLYPLTYETSGFVTWDPQGASVRSITNTKVFNTSTKKAWSGESPQVTTKTVYYPTLKDAGYSSIDAITLPDGSKWNDGWCGVTPPPVTVKIDSVSVITITSMKTFYSDGSVKQKTDSLKLKQ